MSFEIPEADWRQFKKVHKKLLERFCERVLAEVERTVRSGGGTAHERYVQVYQLLKKRDKELAQAFDDYRRSTAFAQLVTMMSTELLTEEDLQGFSPGTQEKLQKIRSLMNPRPASPNRPL